jgi:hypothetical protein
MTSDWRKLLKQARRAGWRVEKPTGGNSYWKCWSPDGEALVVVPGTPSSSDRALQNKRAEFKRAGVRS